VTELYFNMIGVFYRRNKQMRGVGALFLVLFLALPASAEQRMYMLDFVYLNKNVELAARTAYNAKAVPVAARHGVRLQATLDPVKIVLGPTDLARLDLWTLPEPNALQAWGRDPDFKAMQPESRAVHDMSKLTLFLAREIAPFQVKPGAHYWVEFLRFSESGFNGDDFSAYVREIDGIAAQSRMYRVATFGKVGRILGKGHEAHWMNIYSVPDAPSLQAHVKNPRFVELAKVRERLFDLDKSLMAVFQSR